MESLANIEGFNISFSEYSKRIIKIEIEDEIIDKLVFPFKKFDITALEYKPFTRFTLAKSLDESTSEKIGKFINSIIRNRNTGCFVIGPKNTSKKVDNSFLIKLSTAVTHLIGNPNFEVS